MMDVLGRALGAQPNQQAYAHANPNASFLRPNARRRRRPFQTPVDGIGGATVHDVVPHPEMPPIPPQPVAPDVQNFIPQHPVEQMPAAPAGPVHRDPTVGQMPPMVAPEPMVPEVQNYIPRPPEQAAPSVQNFIPQRTPQLGGVQNYLPRRDPRLAHLFSGLA